METKNIILIVIVILVIALAAVGAYIYTSDNNIVENLNITSDDNNNTTSSVINVTDTVDVNNTTVVGDNSPNTENLTSDNNTTEYKVYNPQSDSYVPVIGEAYDDEVDRWYTYDTDGVRYYNTRIN